MSHGVDGVVACGGDGTVHQVVNGLMSTELGQSRPVLGVLPAGRCNDLAMALGIPRREGSAAIGAILDGDSFTMDLGRIGSRYFSTVATLGFDSEVAGYVEEGKAPGFMKGRVAYIYAVLVKLFRYRDVAVEMKGDFGEYSGDIFLAATGNTRFYGGGMMIVPPAEPHDGRLDLCLVRSAPRLDVVRMITKIFSGGHLKHPSVSMHAVTKLELSSTQEVWLWADGERIAQLPATIDVVHGCLDVRVPRQEGQQQ